VPVDESVMESEHGHRIAGDLISLAPKP
jgi:hypothetical protein